MSPAAITALATLLGEAASAGVSIAAILREARATGKVTDEQWAAISDEVKQAEAGWWAGRE